MIEFITEIKKALRESRYNDADQNTDSSSFQYIWRGWSGEGGGGAYIRGICIRMLSFCLRRDLPIIGGGL